MLRIVQADQDDPFTRTEDLALRADLDQAEMNVPAASDARSSLSDHQRQHVWDAAARTLMPALLRTLPVNKEWLELPAANEGQDLMMGYVSLGQMPKHYPMVLLLSLL